MVHGLVFETANLGRGRTVGVCMAINNYKIITRLGSSHPTFGAVRSFSALVVRMMRSGSAVGRAILQLDI